MREVTSGNQVSSYSVDILK